MKRGIFDPTRGELISKFTGTCTPPKRRSTKMDDKDILAWHMCHILEANLAPKHIVRKCGGRTAVRVAGRFVIAAWKRLCVNEHIEPPENAQQLTLEDYIARNAELERVGTLLYDEVGDYEYSLGNCGPDPTYAQQAWDDLH
jgi:hypothetical protein